MAAQKAFFAMISGQAPVTAAPPAAPTPTPLARAVSPTAEAPHKIPRPGSVLDIRV
jgi:hypothetical protein